MNCVRFFAPLCALVVGIGVWGNSEASASASSASRELFTVVRLQQPNAWVRQIERMAQRGYLPNLDLPRFRQIVGYLRGKSGQMLGLRWSKGVRGTILLRNFPATQGQAIPFWQLAQPWEQHRVRLKTMLPRLEASLEIRLSNTFLLRFLLSKFLPYVRLPSAKANYDGIQSYWVRTPARVTVVLIPRVDRLVVAFVTSTRKFRQESWRRQVWAQQLRFRLSQAYRTAVRTHEKRLSQVIHQQDQAMLYVNIKTLQRVASLWPRTARVLAQPAWKALGACAVGGWVLGRELRFRERCWYPQGQALTPRSFDLPQQPKLLSWIPKGMTLSGSLWKGSVLSSVGPSRGTRSYLVPPFLRRGRDFDALLQQAWRRFWTHHTALHRGLWLSKRQLVSWSMDLSLMGESVFWADAPARTKQRLQGVALGRLSPDVAALLWKELESLLGWGFTETWGSVPVLLLRRRDGRWALLSQEAGFWVLASSPRLYQQAMSLIVKRQAGNSAAQDDSQSLYQLRSWDHRWDIFHLDVAKMRACRRVRRWETRIIRRFPRLASWLQRVQVVEVAARPQASFHDYTYRVAWSLSSMGTAFRYRCAVPFWSWVSARMSRVLAGTLLRQVLDSRPPRAPQLGRTQPQP